MDGLAYSPHCPAAAAERRITAMRVPVRPVPRLLASGVAGTLVAASLLVAPAPATASPVRPPAARDAGAASSGFAPVRTSAARDAHAAGRGFAPTAATYNPATGTQGFGVFVQGNAALGQTSTVGPVAMGGNLTVGSNFTVASQTAGTYTAPGDSVPTGLLVGGSINWSGSNSGGTVSVGSSSYVKVGNMTGSLIPNNGNNPTHVVPAGGNYGSKPQVALATVQPPSSVNQPGLINFAGAFSAFASQSAAMASCANSLTLTNSNGTALSLPLSGNTNAYVTLTPGTQNVLNISAVNLANISTLTFNNSPTSTMPLIINVNTSGVSNSFSWTPGNFNGVQNSGVPYMLWNFSTATQVTIGGSSTVPGTIYAPGATVNDDDQNGLNGGIIAAAYAQGGLNGSPNGGQVQNNPFAGTIQSCATPQLTISLTAGTSTAVPGGIVHYTVSVTNSGSAAYSAATFTDSLSGVIDDATYDGDASATAGSVSYTSPNLTWTGSLAVGAAATITFSATVNNPDTGDKSLVSTVTSTSTASNCAAGSTDSRFANTVTVLVPGLTITLTASTGTPTVTDLIPALTITKTATVSTTAPGSAVGYTITVADTGQTPYAGAQVTDTLAGVLGDAAYNGDASASNSDASASAGTVGFASPVLTWTGDLSPGNVVTITYSVTVDDPDTGGRILANTAVSPDPGSDCPAGSTDPRCGVTVPVIAGALSITAPISANLGATAPGGSASASLGTVQVIDSRGFGAGWTATVSSTGFNTGNGTAPETIPASDAYYDISGFGSTTGSATFSTAPQTILSGSPQAVVSATNVGGTTSATWDPLIGVNVPPAAIAGQYTATIVHSVS